MASPGGRDIVCDMDSTRPSTPDAAAQSAQQTTLQAKLQEVAEKTGYVRETVAWVFTNVVSRDPNVTPSERTHRGLSAEALCEKLIRHANDCCPGELRVVL